MLAFLNRCAFVPTAYSNTDDFAVNGSAPVTGFYAPADCLSPVVVDTATYNYFAQSADKTQHEEGRAAWDAAGGKLLRAAGTVRNSSNSGALVNFSAAPVVTMGSPVAADMKRAGNLVLVASAVGLNGSIDVAGDPIVRLIHVNGNQLTSFNVSGCTALDNLDCSNNAMTELSVSGCTALTKLNCWSTGIAALDVSSCTALSYLDCNGSLLTTLDLSAALTYLDFSNNPLATVDLSGCPALGTLLCRFNSSLTALDISACVVLFNLDCSDASFTESMVDALLAALDTNGQTDGTAQFGGTNAPPSAAGLTSKSNLEGKGWTVTVN